MIRLTDLSSDLLCWIFDYLSKKEYRSLSQVCHTLNAEATPYLYGNIRFTATKSPSCARKLALLLRTLFERPHLSTHVIAFELAGPQQCWEKYDPWPENNERVKAIKLWGLVKSTQNQALLTPEMFHHFIDSDMQISQGDLRGRSKDALATLVMTRLMNLQVLDIGDGFLRHSQFLPQLLKRTGYLFPDLERVILGDRQPPRSHTVSYTDLNLIRPMFYSSSTVRTLECTMAQPWQFHWDSARSWNTGLTNLRLFRTNITRHTLHHLLSAAPNLKRFYYEQEILFNSSTPQAPSLAPYLELDGLNTALACVKNTLEECRLILRLAPGSISSSQYISSGIEFPAIDGTLTMLKEMRRLQIVEVPMVMFFGWFPRSSVQLEEILPSNLTELTLRDDFVPFCCWTRPSSRARRIARIGKYIESRARHAPRLRTIKVRLTSAKESLREAMQHLSVLTEEKGNHNTFLQGTKSETYYWKFERTRASTMRPELGERVDSMLGEDEPLLLDAYCNGGSG